MASGTLVKNITLNDVEIIRIAAATTVNITLNGGQRANLLLATTGSNLGRTSLYSLVSYSTTTSSRYILKLSASETGANIQITSTDAGFTMVSNSGVAISIIILLGDVSISFTI